MGSIRAWWLACGIVSLILAPADADMLALYPFTSNSPQASLVAPGLQAGPVVLSSGSVSYNTANAASWTGTSGVPYARGSSGWTASSQELARHFTFTLSGAGVSFSVTNISLWWRRTSAGPSNGGVRVEADVVYAEALPVNSTVEVRIPVNLPNRTGITVRIDGWGNTGTGSGEFQIDDITIEGAVVAPEAPDWPSSNLVAVAEGTGRIRFQWQPGDGQRRLLVVREGGEVEGRPAARTGYAAAAEWGAGDELAPGEFVVYDGDAETNVVVTGLAAGAGYTAALFDYNGAGEWAAYQTSVFATAHGQTFPVNSNETGSVRWQLGPAAAVEDGAMWRIDGGAWLPDGFQTNLPADVYGIDFLPVSGWATPEPTNIAVVAGDSFVFTALYRSDIARVRVATYNIEVGLGPAGSDDYESVKAILKRVDADIVAFQELRANSSNEWVQLAGELGYSNRAWGVANGSLSGGHFLGYFSRYPITDVHHVFSPPGANEMTRPPMRVSVAVPGIDTPLVLWNVHAKASGFNTDAFRRAIEARRLVEDIDQYTAAHTNHLYVVLGDFNDDVNDFQVVSIGAAPTDLPASYVLGSDITFPVLYHAYPTDRIGGAGDGLQRVPSWQQDGVSDGTYQSGRSIDYIYISPALHAKQPASYWAEAYNAFWEGTFAGLPKAGAPVATNASGLASDHFPVFVDLMLEDAVDLPPPLELVGDGWTWVVDEGSWPAATQWVSLVNQAGVDIAWTSMPGSAWVTLTPDHGVVPAGTGVAVGVTASPVVAGWAGDTYSFAYVVQDRTYGQQTNMVGRLIVRDGMDETWRAGWFGTPYPDAVRQTRAVDDADGDGFTNGEEYIADTDPTSEDSRFGGIGWFQLGADWYAYVSPASSNRVYMLERRRGGLAGDWEPVEWGPGQDGWWYREVGDRGPEESYFRINVRLP